VYTIHGLYRNKVIPLLLGLLPKKTREIYRRFLTLVLEKIDALQKKDALYANAIKKFTSLAFCKIEDVQQRFETLSDNFFEEFGHTEPHEQFIQYLENTWIGRPRFTARFPKEMWNCKDVTEMDLPRTTNSLENWHRQLQRTFGFSAHPNFFRFLDGYLDENLRANAICVKLDAGQEVPLYTRKEYRIANQRLLTIIARYELFPDDYLTQCSHYVYYLL